ncbi:uncharacterized protein [Tenebrio molitor]|uniref:uncharacterized protein n=1 Tax=Tenebrio molitor TaxID=7067 RepID=UPI00362484DE
MGSIPTRISLEDLTDEFEKLNTISITWRHWKTSPIRNLSVSTSRLATTSTTADPDREDPPAPGSRARHDGDRTHPSESFATVEAAMTEGENSTTFFRIAPGAKKTAERGRRKSEGDAGTSWK